MIDHGVGFYSLVETHLYCNWCMVCMVHECMVDADFGQPRGSSTKTSSWYQSHMWDQTSEVSGVECTTVVFYALNPWGTCIFSNIIHLHNRTRSDFPLIWVDCRCLIYHIWGSLTFFQVPTATATAIPGCVWLFWLLYYKVPCATENRADAV